ncbi:phosphoribosylanthranilate isomerase [Falsirhodobacter sp. alg1]|uniref:phosphoribosylanthranilate isomerase n=1 Tax=Falsirhodobacter sp. alg1 TaxID=1472418 RepID=UPI0005EFCAAA|nr:phosphoribosylanthranilate isomerase [Falsirhodobacter sp. alg1]
MSAIRVKICGLKTPEDMLVVAKAGAHYAGLVFYPPSPRNLDLQTARDVALAAPVGLAKVALVVDASDDDLDALVAEVPLDMLQLHGSETPERVAEIRARFGLPVMKAIGVADEGDLAGLMEMSLVADQLLIDAKPPKNADLPGGNGLSFDWRLVAQRRWLKPWMLAGGLSAENVAEAIRLTNARQVDVSSGVESVRGIKDHGKIAAFARAAMAPPIPRLR